MHLRTLLLSSTLAIAAVAGCYTGSAVDTNRPPEGATTETDGTEPGADGTSGGNPTGTATRLPKGLPCDVAELLEKECNGCHGPNLSGGAPNRLVSFNDLVAKSESDPELTTARSSLDRMKSSVAPMPPTGKLPAGKIAILENWIKAGMPNGTCRESVPDAGSPQPPPVEPPPVEPPPPDGGVSPMPDAAPPGPGPSVCTSGDTTPEPGNHEWMRPGDNCLRCHKVDGPAKRYPFTVAGTVYPTRNEPNGCLGAKDVKVVVFDSEGKIHEMLTNDAGNFFTLEAIPKPFRVRVMQGTKEPRDMPMLQQIGDCNGCHAADGGKNGAKGRIPAP